MYEDQPGRELPIWGDHEGWVNVEAPHNMDAYWITRIVRSDIGRTFFNIRDLMSSRVDELKGAMIVMIDDRTLTEQQDGTFTDTGRNPPGTVRTIASNTDNYGSAYSRVGLSVAWPVVPQEGAVVALFWPIRDRLITEIYTQNPETYKRLSRLQARVKARNDGHLKIRVTGQPEALNSDDILNDLPFDVSASLAQAGDVYGATISRFQSANQREIDFWIHAPHDQGRKFYVMFEEFSIEDSEIYGWVTEMQSLGYR
jgi:hypothetical protein